MSPRFFSLRKGTALLVLIVATLFMGADLFHIPITGSVLLTHDWFVLTAFLAVTLTALYGLARGRTWGRCGACQRV